MNRIQELIKELCPNGVEWKKLGEICSVYDGTHQTPKYVEDGIPFISVENIKDIYNSKKYISKEAFDAYKIKPQIGDVFLTRIGTIGACAVFNKQEDIAYYVSLALLRPSNTLNSYYLKYILESSIGVAELRKRTLINAVPIKVNKEEIGKIEIPVPPLPVQTEIVRILDKFVEQQEQLEKLIELRKKQYEYYREEMLTAKEGWETVTIGDLCTITRGRRFVRDDVRSSGMPCIHYGDMYTYYGITARTTKTFLDRDFPKKMQYAKKGDVVVVGAGENDLDIGVGTVWEGDEPAAVHDACYILEHKQNPKYIAYFLRTNNYHQQLRKFVSEGKICSISGTGLGSCFIPLPSLTKQQEIVDFLDKFEDNISVMKSTLEASKKRYEHYRDEMLRF